jgi:hypothetical protein
LDYVATQGRIDMRVGQDHVAIPVTILGDKFAEADETFMLEVKLGGNYLGCCAYHCGQ